MDDASRPASAILIQARSSSSRLPRKCFLPLPPVMAPAVSADGPSILEWVFRRMQSTGIPVFCLVPADDEVLRSFCEGHGWPVLTGPLEDVRERYRMAARELGLDTIVRVTGDNPLTDPESVRLCLNRFRELRCDLFSFSGLPVGMGVEVFSASALLRDVEPIEPMHREHVSLHIKHFPELFRVRHEVDPRLCRLAPELADRIAHLRLTLDESADYGTLVAVVQALAIRRDGEVDACSIGLEGVIDLFVRQPELFDGNAHVEQRRFQRQR